MDAVCPRHPEHAAVAACARCGGFVCHADRTLVDQRTYCPDCAQRDDVDWLGAYQRRLWGKRDAWAWFYGLTALGHLVQTTTGVIGEAWPTAIHGVLAALGSLGFFLGVPAARVALPVVHLGAIAAALLLGDLGLGVLAGGAALVLVSALSDTRSRLFFKLPVPRERLARYWRTYADNPAARHSVNLAALGLLVPFLGTLAVALGVFALTRVDQQARPPVGRGGLAVAGVALGLVDLGLHTSLVLGWWW